MRKISLLFLLMACCLFIKAQQITFLSIPLKGNVETFTTKLKGVGISLDKEISKNLEIGKRAFDVSILNTPLTHSLNMTLSLKMSMKEF